MIRSERFVGHLQTSDAAKLETAARTYVWLAEFGPGLVRGLYHQQRDAVLEECERRGLSGVVDKIRQEFAVRAGTATLRAV